MREALGNDLAARAALQPVVAHRRGGAETFLDVASLQDAAHLLRAPRPDPRETIRLELHPYRERVALRLPGARPEFPDPLRDAEFRLHVVADLMGDHIGLGEVAGGAELPLHVPEE